MTALLNEPNTIQSSRPRPGAATRPGPGYQVAPPVAADAFAPWAAVLEQPSPSGLYRWEMGPEGALLPVPMTEDEAAAQAKRTVFGMLLGGLLRH